MTRRASHDPAFTGRHMAAIMVSFFGVVIAVNLTMAYFASRSFGGLVVENSYVASQSFNGWLAQARAQDALDWTLTPTRQPDDRLVLSLRAGDQPLNGARVTALARHPLGGAADRALRFREAGAGRYRSVEPLPLGRWAVHVTIAAGGQVKRDLIDLP
jgi:nitrogen fixation protein FixH